MGANNYFSKLVLFVMVFFSAKSINCQRLTTIKNTCGLYYRSMAGLKKDQGTALQFYRFNPGDTIASIGAQACNWEAAYAAVSDSVFFYLEDIDTVYCNARQAALAWQYYNTLKDNDITGGHTIVIGDEKSTHLPTRSCDKILIINSFHEFTYPEEMLHDIARKLKPNGILYIDETMALYPGELHVNCNKPLLTEDKLVKFAESNGFKYINSREIAFKNLAIKVRWSTFEA